MSYSQYGKDSLNNYYYNVTINNLNSNGNSIFASFSENRVQDILPEPSNNFYLTVVRFSIPGSEIPIFIMPVQLGQPDVNLTPFSVTLSYLGNDFRVYLSYVTHDITAPIPAQPLISQDISSGYYYVYTYQDMLNYVNTALASAFNSLKSAFPTAPPTEAPYFIYNPDTELISLVTQFSYSLPNSISIYTNLSLLTYFDALRVDFYGPNSINGKDSRFIIEFTHNNSYAKPGGIIPSPPANPDYLIFTQEFLALGKWNSMKSIVFLTGTLPINYESVPQSPLLSSTNISLGANNFRPILTDFEPYLDQIAGSTRSIFQFYVQGPYRLIDLTSSTTIRQFDVQVFWQDHFGQLYPVYISYGQVVTIKFLFIRKKTLTGYP